MVPARLKFFIYLGSFLRKLLVLLQTDNPVTPFSKDELGKIVKQLARLVFTKSAMDEAGTIVNIIQKSFSNDKEHLCENIGGVGSASKACLDRTHVF